MTLAGRCAGRRIAIVIHSFDRGGSGRVAGHLARGFADLGMAVRVLVFSPDGAAADIARTLIGPGIPIRILGRAHGSRALDLLRGLPALVSALRHEREEIVLAAANNVALPTALAFRLARVPDSRLYLKTTNPIASSRHRGIPRAVRRAGYRAIFPWTSAVLTLSAAEAAEMDAAFPAFRGLFRAVANPYVTPAMLAPAPPRADGPPTIVSVARLDPQKRLERLIAAFARLSHRDARLLILGEGAERPALEALVARLGLGARVSMPGHVADVVPALHAADLFVLTSDYEGLPAAALEAMAADCPVFSTPCFPGAHALLEAAPGCGIIASTEPEALAAQIDACLDRPRPPTLHNVAERYSIANGIASHAEAIVEQRR